MFEPFILRAIIAGLAVSIVAGVMGCFLVWRRMAYFGDSLAHSTFLGIALGLASGISRDLGVLLICFVFALLLLILQHRKFLAIDTLLGVLAHAALSCGIVILSLLDVSFNLHAYFFGDVLTVTIGELYGISAGSALILILLVKSWPSLVLMTLDEDLAFAEGAPVFHLQLLFMFLMALIVAISIHIVGILLITSMLIIPAATARFIVRSPEMMAIAASIFAMIAVITGILGSFFWNTPSGPTIILALIVLFILSFATSFHQKT